MKADPSVTRLRFDRFELDEAEARLTCAGEPVALAPKPFAVLCALARTPDSLVTKNALLDLVWGHRFVTESVLKTAISEVRAALDDDPKQPRYIETVSRRGYRFIAATVGASSQPAPAIERDQALRATTPPLRHSRHCAAATRRSPSSFAWSPPRWSASRWSSTSPSQRASHETLRAAPKRSVSPADRGDRRPARAPTVPAPADAVGLLAAARPRGGGALGLHLAGYTPCTRK